MTSTPALLADNDALLKAAHWGLLDQVPALAGTTWTGVSVLPQFPPRVARAEPKLFADPQVATDLSASLAQCAPLPEPDPGVLAALQDQPGLDSGEILLLAVLARLPGAVLLTGDKRALVTLSKLMHLEVLCGIAERMLCVEQLLWSAVDTVGAPAMVAQVRRWGARDQAVLAIVGSQGDKSEAQLREGLASYVSALNAEAPGLLAPRLGHPG